MGDKVKILEDLSTLTKMCRSKSDGASLKIEEEEINTKIKDLKSEIEEIKATSEEDNYDTSAEMADRNIEIITKKLIQTLKNELKTKNQNMEELKQDEEEKSNNLNNLKNTKESHEKYIASMQDRITTSTDNEVINRYNSLISSTQEKINKINEEINEQKKQYDDVQNSIDKLSEEINSLQETLDKKKEQLQEAQKNLENKEVYIDKNKAERSAKKIEELQNRIDKHLQRLEEIYKDPKYLEVKIKDIINNNEDPFNARSYLIQLLTICIKQPYMNVDTDNALEEELLRATQARDSFANEIDQKTYDIMDTINPEQIRIEFLNNRITSWNEELNNLQNKISMIDKDEQYHYEEKSKTLEELIQGLKEDLEEYRKAYENESSANLSAKATLKVAYDEKKEDLKAALAIADKFRQEEAEDISNASQLIKTDVAKLQDNINAANEEINTIKARLMSKKSGMKDIGAQNKDREKLKELANVVINIKHRRQFAEKPLDIAKRLEENLGLDLVNAILSSKDPASITNPSTSTEDKRGIKVINETAIKTTSPEPKPVEENTAPEENQPEATATDKDKNNDEINNYINNEEDKVEEIKGIEKDSIVNELDNYINNLGLQA